MIPYLGTALTMTAVGDAAFEMIEEVRRQFREIPGLIEGTAKPDARKCVDIATVAALRRMILPGLLAVLAPVARATRTARRTRPQHPPPRHRLPRSSSARPLW